MDEVSAKAQLATVESGLTVAVPKSEVLTAVDGEGADLVLDVVRQNGAREERRVTLAWDPATLRKLVDEADGDRVLIAIDPASLAVAFDDVDAHGMREVGATLAIAVAALGSAGGAAAALDPGAVHQASAQLPAVEATVDSGSVRGTPAESAQTRTVEAGMPRAMPSDYAQARAGEAGMPRAMPSDYAAQAGVENVRAAQEAPEATPDPMSGIENVRAGGAAVPDATSGIEQVRAERSPASAGDVSAQPTGRTTPGNTGEGSSISASSAGEAAAIVGGALLTIAAATFALRRGREPEPAT